MLKRKLILFGLTATLLLSGCQEEVVDEVKAPAPETGTTEEQIAELQEDFHEIIGERDSDYGKLVFYSLENEDEDKGVGLAMFDEEDGQWVYATGTAHLVSDNPETTSFPSDRIEINDEVKVVYGYISHSAIEGIEEVQSEDIVDGTLEVRDSVISYTFVSPEQDITVLPNE